MTIFGPFGRAVRDAAVPWWVGPISVITAVVVGGGVVASTSSARAVDLEPWVVLVGFAVVAAVLLVGGAILAVRVNGPGRAERFDGITAQGFLDERHDRLASSGAVPQRERTKVAAAAWREQRVTAPWAVAALAGGPAFLLTSLVTAQVLLGDWLRGASLIGVLVPMLIPIARTVRARRVWERAASTDETDVDP